MASWDLRKMSWKRSRRAESYESEIRGQKSEVRRPRWCNEGFVSAPCGEGNCLTPTKFSKACASYLSRQATRVPTREDCWQVMALKSSRSNRKKAVSILFVTTGSTRTLMPHRGSLNAI